MSSLKTINRQTHDILYDIFYLKIYGIEFNNKRHGPCKIQLVYRCVKKTIDYIF